MILVHNYFYFKKAVPIKTCKKIIKAGRKLITTQAIVGEKEIDFVRRDCRVAWINEKWIYGVLNPFIHLANKKARWNFQWDWNEPSQFTVYEKGHHYNWHIDQTPPSKNKDRNFYGKIRKLSLTLQLTDKSKYTGGDFQFKWIDEDEIKTTTVRDAKDIGSIIIFPSFIHHRIVPITKGKRESLVNWSIGKPFK